MAKKVESLNKKLLAAAISATKASEIKKLVEEGAEINCHNEWGLSPVMLAAQYNHCVAITKALIDLGADIHEAEPKYRSNALHLAANNSDNPKVVEVLLDAGANIDARNYLGETALCSRVCKGRKENIPHQPSQGEGCQLIRNRKASVKKRIRIFQCESSYFFCSQLQYSGPTGSSSARRP